MTVEDWTAGVERMVDPNSPTPLYHQVFLSLKAGIQRGEILDGALLPNELQLAELYRVSRITIKRALAELSAEGMVVRRRGIGTLVHSPPPQQPLVYGSFDSWIENLDALGRDVEVELLGVENVGADRQVAALLGLEVGAEVQRVVRLRKVGGVPFAHVVAWVPAAIAARYDHSALKSVQMMSLLERAGCRPASAEQWISAHASPPEVAAAFDMSSAEPIMLLEQVMRDEAGAAIQFLRAFYHGERFRYHVKIGRPA
jgi:GntR family transcriptional regulator